MQPGVDVTVGGSQKGLIFAGNAGSCVITISQNTLSVTVPGTIQSFTPTERSSIPWMVPRTRSARRPTRISSSAASAP